MATIISEREESVEGKRPFDMRVTQGVEFTTTIISKINEADLKNLYLLVGIVGTNGVETAIPMDADDAEHIALRMLDYVRQMRSGRLCDD